MLSQQEIDKLRESYKRCITTPAFITHFYKNFLATSSDIARQFEHTVMIKQKAMLIEALAHLINFVESGTPSKRLTQAAIKHGRNYLNIKPAYYSSFKTHLLIAIKTYDTHYDSELEKLWINVIDAGINFFIDNY